MWQFFKQIIQLLLHPAEGWKDISEAAKSPESIQLTGFYPWICLVALSQLLQLFYNPDLTVIMAIESAIISVATLFASLYIVKYLLEFLLIVKIDKRIQPSKIHTFSIYAISTLGIFMIIINAVPASINLIHILPFFCLLPIYHATKFFNIPEDKIILYFIGTAVIAWFIPLAFTNIMVSLI